MPPRSAGLLLYRDTHGRLEVLLVHPGGPFWARKDAGAWSIPKGAVDEGEDPRTAAFREFREEIGFPVEGPAVALAPIKQPSGKLIMVWTLRGDADLGAFKSNTFPLEWPPGSGTMREFPEVDRAAWFDMDTARQKILKGQAGFLDELERRLGEDIP